MKVEQRVLVYSMINNLIIAIIKFIGGAVFGLGSLLADGMHTFSDFVTDIVCLIGSKISKKKPTKYHPFGFGRVEYLTNLFVGVVLLLLGVYIVVSSFFKESVIPPLSLLYLLVFVFLIKVIAIIVMYHIGKKINSGILITSVEESKADLYSTLGVVLITILLQYSNEFSILKYADMIGSILIGLIVLKTAFKIIIDNSLSLLGEVDEDEAPINNLKNLLKEYKRIKDYDIELIKYGSYYKLQMNLELDPTLSLRQVTNLVNKLKKDIRYHHSLKIKYVTIYVTDKLEK